MNINLKILYCAVSNLVLHDVRRWLQRSADCG